MSHMVLEIHNFLERAISQVISAFKPVFNIIKGLHNSFVEARMLQAQHKVAEHLWQTEYRNQSFYAVLEAVKDNDLDRLR